MGWLSDSEEQAAPSSSWGNFFTAVATQAVQKAGVNLGATSAQAHASPPIQGRPTQAPQPQFTSSLAQKPIVMIGAAVAVLVLLWVLVRGRK